MVYMLIYVLIALLVTLGIESIYLSIQVNFSNYFGCNYGFYKEVLKKVSKEKEYDIYKGTFSEFKQKFREIENWICEDNIDSLLKAFPNSLFKMEWTANNKLFKIAYIHAGYLILDGKFWMLNIIDFYKVMMLIKDKTKELAKQV